MLDQPDLQVISGRLERGEIDSAQYLEQLMRYVAAQIGCSRAGLRLFVETAGGRALRCVAMYDAAHDRMVSAADIVHADSSSYLERLQRDGSVSAGQALADPAATGALREHDGELSGWGRAGSQLRDTLNEILYQANIEEGVGLG